MNIKLNFIHGIKSLEFWVKRIRTMYSENIKITVITSFGSLFLLWCHGHSLPYSTCYHPVDKGDTICTEQLIRRTFPRGAAGWNDCPGVPSVCF